MGKFRIALWLLLLVSLATSLDAQPRKKRSKGAEKDAKEHLMYEEYEEAIPHITSLLEQDPGSAYYNFWMGKCLYLTYKKNQALPYLEKVDHINPEVDEEFHYFYALTLHYNLRLDEAIQQYRLEMERHDPGSAAYREINNRISQCQYARNYNNKRESKLVKIENLGQHVNTPYAEHSPVIAGNDSVLLFTARRPECLGAQPEAHFYDEDIYIAYKQGDHWTKGTNIGTPVNSKGHDATISMTNDGKRLYLYRHKKAGGLYVTDFDEEGKEWNEPKKIEKPLNSKFYEASICESADGNRLFFTSDRPGGLGGRDIYMVHRRSEKDNWSEPLNLGAPINTPFDEDAPFLHPDGRTFYYSSNGPISMGGFDIFVTEYDSMNGVWLEPLNMGPPVNTPDDDIYFVLSDNGLNGYYSSGKEGGYGEKDIYRIKFPYFRYPKREYVIEVVGIVQDVESLDTLPAMIRLVDAGDNRVLDSFPTTPERREYMFEVEPERAYTLEVVADGYERNLEEFTTPMLDDEDVFLRKDVLVKRPKVLETEELLPEIQHVYFDFDKSDLRQTSVNELDMVADMLRQNKEMTVKILGHTDYYGTYDYNVELSEERTDAVKEYLLQAGIALSRIQMDWKSENKPIETNEDDTGRQFNRRVEFKFYRDSSPLFSSVKLRRGSEGPVVDHTRPKGLPGYDNPDGTPVAAMSPSTLETEEDVWVSSGKNAVKAVNSNDSGSNTSSNDESGDALAGISLQHIYFDFDRFGLRQESRNELNRVAKILKENPKYTLDIYGHTDAWGSDGYNQTLSENRANAALEYLVANGISESRLNLTGYSEYKPLDSNDDASGRQNNRRVEFTLKKGGSAVLASRP